MVFIKILFYVKYYLATRFLLQLQVIKLKNSIDGEIFKDLQQIASEHGIATTKSFEEGTETDKPVNFITVKEEALIRKRLVFKAAFKDKCDAREQRCYGGMEVILSTTGELGAPKEEPARLGLFDITHGSQESDAKMEEEECENEEKGCKVAHEENNCGHASHEKSPCFCLADKNAHHTSGPSGSENNMSPIEKDPKEVKIDMRQEYHLDEMLHADNFHSNDLLCFAWQIAKGMVSNANEDSLVSIVIFKAANYGAVLVIFISRDVITYLLKDSIFSDYVDRDC